MMETEALGMFDDPTPHGDGCDPMTCTASYGGDHSDECVRPSAADAEFARLATIAILQYDDPDPAKAQASTDAENRLAEQFGHPEPCSYTIKATVGERIDHYREQSCTEADDAAMERHEETAAALPLEKALEIGQEALGDRYEDGYGPGSEELGLEVAYLAASGLLQQGYYAIAFLREHSGAILEALDSRPGEHIGAALEALYALDLYITGIETA